MHFQISAIFWLGIQEEILPHPCLAVLQGYISLNQQKDHN